MRDEGVPTLAPFGWELVGALKTSMHADSECIVIWAIESWQHWAEYEKAVYADPTVQGLARPPVAARGASSAS